MSDSSDPELLETAMWAGDPAITELGILGAMFEAAQRGPCPDCGAAWVTDCGPVGDAPPILLIEHDDSCPTTPTNGSYDSNVIGWQ